MQKSHWEINCTLRLQSGYGRGTRTLARPPTFETLALSVAIAPPAKNHYLPHIKKSEHFLH